MSRSVSKGSFFCRAGAASALALVLIGCGGGGGGGGGSSGIAAPPATPISITSTNSSTVARESVGALMQSGDTSALVTGVSASAEPSAPMPLMRLLDSSMRRLSSAPSVPVEAQATGAQVTATVTSQPCANSGSVSVDDSGTSAMLSFNACSDLPGESVNGTISITGIQGTNTNFSANVAIDVTIASGAQTVRTQGSFGISFAQSGTIDNIVITGSNLFLVNGSDVVAISNFSLSSTVDMSTGDVTVSGGYTVASTKLNGSVTVSTGTPFRQIEGRNHPFQGQLTITGASNGHVRVTILGDETAAPTSQVQIELDLDGNNSYDPPINKTWAEIDAA